MCDCISQINEQLAEQGAEVTQRILVSQSLSDLSVSPPVLLATYCPFCGERIEREETPQ